MTNCNTCGARIIGECALCLDLEIEEIKREFKRVVIKGLRA